MRTCYLLDGEEEYTKQKALDDLRDKLLVNDFAMMNETVLTDPAADLLIATAETLPMMADKRLVIVRDSSHLAGRAQREEDAQSSASDGDRITAYLQKLPDTVCLVFVVRGKANGTRKLYKQLYKMGAVVTFDRLSHADLIRWVARDLARWASASPPMPPSAAVYLRRGHEPAPGGELARLCGRCRNHYARGCRAIATRTTEYKVFDLADAVLSSQAEKAVTLMNGMIRDGEARLFCWRCCKGSAGSCLCKLLGPARGQLRGSVLGVPPFVARKL